MNVVRCPDGVPSAAQLLMVIIGIKDFYAQAYHFGRES